MIFAVVAVPVVAGIGVSIDYNRALNVRSKMQHDLDSAMIAAVKKIDSVNADQLKLQVNKWFSAQVTDGETQYSLLTDQMTIDTSGRAIKATATGVVPTTFLGILNIPSINVSVSTSVQGPSSSYLNVYLVLDKSASMLLAATTSGQTTMKNSSAGCVFACHTAEGGSHSYNGVAYANNYLLSKAMGVKLRADVAVTAAQEVLDLVTAADPTQSHIKVGLYTIGANAAQVLAPSNSMTTVRSTLLNDSNGLTSATSQDTTALDTSLTTLTGLIGTAGDGSSPTRPLKLVLLLTDGVQSTRDWVIYNPYNNWRCVTYVGSSCVKFNPADFPRQKYTSPLDPSWCSPLKGSNMTLGVLYTEYLSISYDWGYNGTVGSTMGESTFTGAIQTGVVTTTTRRDYIPYALKSCASTDMFISAANPTAIENGLSTLFKQYLGSVRLTQ